MVADGIPGGAASRFEALPPNALSTELAVSACCQFVPPLVFDMDAAVLV